MFALDYLSVDEDEPTRRLATLSSYLPPGTDAQLGWNGHGRQRAEAALPGTTYIGDGLLWVDVQVRVVPYTRIDARPRPAAARPVPHAAASVPDRGPTWRPSSAPSLITDGWAPELAHWVQLWVPVRREPRARVGLVIDARVAVGPWTGR